MPDTPRPEVSVIVPTHNRSAWLREAVRSVQAQSLASWECIVADEPVTRRREPTGSARVATDGERAR